ncbi:MAG: lipoyl(octanoyl) transferase LipB [Methylophilaceae bacterium]
MQIITRDLGRTDYQTTLTAMQHFTAKRNQDTADELWLTEHYSVYTLGLNRKDVRLPQTDIPLILSDRGGKITYHGQGQVIIYLLVDLNRCQFKVRQLVSVIENSLIELLANYDVVAFAKKEAPGVYVGNKKIASVGLRLKNNYCYHGLSLNVDMDLAPFLAIDPCGYKGLEMTQTKELSIFKTPHQMGLMLLDILKKNLQND